MSYKEPKIAPETAISIVVSTVKLIEDGGGKKFSKYQEKEINNTGINQADLNRYFPYRVFEIKFP